MRLLFFSTPVAPIGSGDGGGVETTLLQLAPALRMRGHETAVIAPEGSRMPEGVPLHVAGGDPPPSAVVLARDISVAAQPTGVLERMWDLARQLAPRFDAIVSLSYDWLSYYLTPFLPVPVLHLVTLPSCIDTVDCAMRGQYLRRPARFAFVSRTQAASFGFVDLKRVRMIPGAVDTDQFHFRASAEPMLCWAARISPEKGLEDAIRVAQAAGLPLHICGKIQDETYWCEIRRAVAAEALVYHGFLRHADLREVVGRSAAMLVTPKWVEAFGLNVIEALACGTPVIAYERGGPAEIVEHGRSGFLTPAGDIGAMAQAVKQIGSLRRADARQRAEQFGVACLAERVEAWVKEVCVRAEVCGKAAAC